MCWALGYECCLLPKPWPSVTWLRSVGLTRPALVAGRTRLRDRTPRHKMADTRTLPLGCLWLRSPRLVPQALTLWLQHRLPAASLATLWLYSWFPTGVLRPGAAPRLAPFRSPVQIAPPGSAVHYPFVPATAHCPFFPCDNQFPVCCLQAAALPLHPPLQGPFFRPVPLHAQNCAVPDYMAPWLDVTVIWLAILSRKCLWPGPFPVGHSKEEEWCQHIR